MRKREERGAYHEAGHAVAAVILHFSLARMHDAVSIIPDNSGEGGWSYSGGRTKVIFCPSLLEYTESKEGTTEDMAIIKRHYIEKYVTLLLAGEAAERRYSAKGIRRVNYVGDHDQAMKKLAGFSNPTSEFNRLRERARVLINSHWTVIEELAATLLVRKTMNGEEAEEFISARCSMEEWLDKEVS